MTGGVSAKSGDRAAKVIVISLLSLLIWSGFAGKEAWPLTSWRLFSRVRTAEQVSWAAVGVTGAGEHVIDFGSLPRPYHGAASILKTWPAMSPRDRLAVCRVWLTTMSDITPTLQGIRVYRTVRRVDPDHALRRPVEVSRKSYGGCDA